MRSSTKASQAHPTLGSLCEICYPNGVVVFLYPYPTDMRKSFDTLSGIVTNRMGMDVMEGDAFIFVNRTCTGMKVLHMECGGLVIYNLRLERGRIELPAISYEDNLS